MSQFKGGPGWDHQLNQPMFGQMVGLVPTVMPAGDLQAGMPGVPGGMGGGMVGLNQAAFGGGQAMGGYGAGRPGGQPHPVGASAQQKARALIGVVTKMQDNYGFVDDDVFFQLSVVKGPVPRVGDRVMVEAQFNPNMPFKWNASRISLASQEQQDSRGGGGGGLDYGGGGRARNGPASSRGNVGPPQRSQRSPPRRRSPPKRSSPRRHSRDRDRSSRKRERSPSRDKSRAAESRSGRRETNSPPRHQRRMAQRYTPHVPKLTYNTNELQPSDVRHRFARMYVPSDFVHTEWSWTRVFPLHRPFAATAHAVTYHVLPKDVDILDADKLPADPPPDVNYSWSAKVMLLASQPPEQLYEKMFNMKGGFVNTEESHDPTPLPRLMSFLCGVKGKSEVLAIGGPWSPSLDGADPEADPRVLIKTAVRTCMSLTGIDLSKCTRWCKVLEVRYRRIEREATPAATGGADGDGASADGSETGGATGEPRVERVVLYLPDIWSVVPTAEEFEATIGRLRDQRDEKLAALEPPPPEPAKGATESAEPEADAAASKDAPATTGDSKTEETPMEAEGSAKSADTTTESVPESGTTTSQDPDTTTESKPEGTTADPEEKAATHWSKLDLKNLKVAELRAELEARGMDSKGIKSQLIGRLTKALKSEEDDEKAEKAADAAAAELKALEGQGEPHVQAEKKDEKKEDEAKDAAEVAKDKEEEEKKKKEAEREERENQRKKEREEREKKEERERKKAQIERHYKFVDEKAAPGLCVWPSKSAKGGKFDCRVYTLQSLCQYRQEDNKEHSFEVAMFAEAFSEMLQRDAAFNVYKALLQSPDPEEERKAKEAAEAAAAAAAAMDTSEGAEKGGESTPATAAANGEESMEDLQVKDEVKEDTEADQAVKQSEKEKSEKEKDKKSKEEKDEKKKREEKEKPPTSFRIVRPEILAAFATFDTTLVGYLQEKDVEDIVHVLPLCLSRAQISRLVRKVTSEDRAKYWRYRKLVEVPKPADPGASVDETINLLEIPDDEELAKGNTPLLVTPPTVEPSPPSTAGGRVTRKSAGGAAAPQDVSGNPAVVFDGRVLDVGQMLAQLDKLEREQGDLVVKIGSLEKTLGSSQEQAETLERKRKRLDDESRDYRKRLHESEKSERKAVDEVKDLKNSLRSARDYARYIERLVDRAIPPPPAPVPAVVAVDKKEDGKEDKPKDGKEEEADDEELAVKDEIVESDKPEADMETS